MRSYAWREGPLPEALPAAEAISAQAARRRAKAELFRRVGAGRQAELGPGVGERSGTVAMRVRYMTERAHARRDAAAAAARAELAGRANTWAGEYPLSETADDKAIMAYVKQREEEWLRERLAQAAAVCKEP
jgi:hypothetical protein